MIWKFLKYLSRKNTFLEIFLNCLTKFSTIQATVSATLSELSKKKGDIEESSFRFLTHNPYISTILGLSKKKGDIEESSFRFLTHNPYISTILGPKLGCHLKLFYKRRTIVVWGCLFGFILWAVCLQKSLAP